MVYIPGQMDQNIVGILKTTSLVINLLYGVALLLIIG